MLKQMKIQYKSFINENDVEFKWGSNLDTMFEPGSYSVEIDKIDEELGLPDEKCSDLHYIVGNLVVTDSGTKGNRQENRVIGQILTFTSYENQQTKIYTRTFANSMWSKWSSLVATDVIDNISTTEDMVSTIAALIKTVDNLQTKVTEVNSRTTVINNELKGVATAKFDFTYGEVANYQSRTYAYKFKAGNRYLLRVLTDDVVATTYFSFRTENGTAVQNSLLTGIGQREGSFLCNEDCDYLYMTIQSDAVAVAYDVEILNLSDDSIKSIAWKNSEQEIKIENIVRSTMKLPAFSDFADGYDLDNYGIYKPTSGYSATENYFYIPANTSLKIRARNYADRRIVVVYNAEYTFVEKFVGQGSDVDVEFTLKYDYPVYIRVATATSLLDYFSIVYEGENFPQSISLLDNRVTSVEESTAMLGKPSTLNYDDFEIGNITIDKTGWAYTDNAKRVRMKAGVTYHLFVGDIIKLPENVRAYVGYRVNGEYKSKAWFTQEWAVTEEGEYKILLSGVTENTLLSKYELLTGVKISGGERRYENTLPIDADALPTLRVINHRGFNTEAPENTLPAFELSKLKGFRYVEVDVQHTSDGVPVCIHDWTVERTSNGGNRRVNEMTFEEIRALDFGSWFSADYAGTQIPTFEEFLILCKRLGLKPYVELKDGTTEQIKHLFDLVRLYGMEKHTTFISFHLQLLQDIASCSTNARVGYVADTYSTDYLNALVNLREIGCDVFANLQRTAVTDDVLMDLRQNGFEVEAWVGYMGLDVVSKLDGITVDNAMFWEYSGNRSVWRSNTNGWKE